MNKFVIGALALSAASSLSYAGSETKEWSSLDRDIAALAQTPAGPASGFNVGGFVRSRFAYSDDVTPDPTNAPNDDLAGFNMDNARLEFSASQGDYGVWVALEGAESSSPGGGDVQLYEAYGTFRITDGISGQMGLFRAPFLWSALISNNHQVLLDRTFNGQVWENRNEGVQLSGNFDMFNWWFAFQNGNDNVGEDYRITARASFNVLGTSIGWQEGAYGASDETQLTIGAAYTDDTNFTDGTSFCVDLGFTQGPFSAHGEIVDYDDDIQFDSAINTSTGVLNPNLIGGTIETPWSATVGYMITPNEYELIGRYEDVDDADDTAAWTVGIVRYVVGHDAKWTLQYSSSDSDVAGKEADTVALGLTVGV